MRVERLLAAVFVMLLLSVSLTPAFADDLNPMAVTPMLTVSTSQTSPQHVSMGSKGVVVFRVVFTTDGVMNLKHPTFTLQVKNDKGHGPSLVNFTLWKGDVPLSEGPASLTPSGPNTWKFSFPLAVAERSAPESPLELTVQADVMTKAEGATSGSEHVFSVATSGDIEAFDVTGPPRQGQLPIRALVSLQNAVSDVVSVFRTNVALSVKALGAQTDRRQVGNDHLAILNISADGDARFERITFSVSGSALVPDRHFVLKLVDAQERRREQTCFVNDSHSCMVTFNLRRHRLVRAGTTRSWLVELVSDRHDIEPGTVAITVDRPTNILVSDGEIHDIPVLDMPLTVAAVTYQ